MAHENPLDGKDVRLKEESTTRGDANLFQGTGMAWYDTKAKGAMGWYMTPTELANGPLKRHLEAVYAQESKRTLNASIRLGLDGQTAINVMKDRTWVIKLTPPETHVLAAFKAEESLSYQT